MYVIINLHIGDINRTITFLRQAVTLQPHLARCHYRLGCIYQEQCDYNQAIICYQNAITLLPNNIGIYYIIYMLHILFISITLFIGIYINILYICYILISLYY